MVIERQYWPGTELGDKPAEIRDPEGDIWIWTDEDGRGIPGYQYVGGVTSPRHFIGMGPAHTREYVEQARYCYMGDGCTHERHLRARRRS